VKAIFARSRQTYGSPRVHRELRRQDVRCSRKRVARIMREQELEGRYPKRRKRTTIPDPDPDPDPPAVDLLGRRFQPEDLALNAYGAGDITYVRTWEGWIYLATVIDLASPPRCRRRHRRRILPDAARREAEEVRRSRRTERPPAGDFHLAKTGDFEMAIDTAAGRPRRIVLLSVVSGQVQLDHPHVYVFDADQSRANRLAPSHVVKRPNSRPRHCWQVRTSGTFVLVP
jgi:hypothetical protein